MMKRESSVQSEHALQSAILTLAAHAGEGWDAAHAWFNEDPIASLDGLTGAELVVADRADQVFQFLLSILADDRTSE